MTELGKPFPKKKSEKSKKKNRKPNLKCRILLKITSKKGKFGSNKKTRPRMNYE